MIHRKVQLFTAPHLQCVYVIELDPEEGHADKVAWHPSTVTTSENAPSDSWLAVVVSTKVIVYNVCLTENKGTGIILSSVYKNKSNCYF